MAPPVTAGGGRPRCPDKGRWPKRRLSIRLDHRHPSRYPLCARLTTSGGNPVDEMSPGERRPTATAGCLADLRRVPVAAPGGRVVRGGRPGPPVVAEPP